MTNNFPPNFVWGTATSSTQIEGAGLLDGKGPSIWDAFCQIPGKVFENQNALVACDHYHRLEEDVQLLVDLGVSAYRFSFSWPRLLPNGRIDHINEQGIKFYNRLIDLLIENNIMPWATLYHWDLPLALQLEEDGWVGAKMPELFEDYAGFCFQHFADRIKNWITINEAWVVAILGYGQGVFAPGRISNSEPYLAGHNLLLAHARAVALYRESYAPKYGGKIGITNNCDWREPATDSPADIAAAQRSLEFFLAWFADPVYKGDYPDSMRSALGERLPVFTPEEQALLKGSSDFFGLNHYTTMYASEASDEIIQGPVYGNGGISEDQNVKLSLDPEWPLTDMQWAIVPWGCRKLLKWISERYDYPDIYITENGCAFPDEIEDQEVHDPQRVAFFKAYLDECSEAIAEGVKLRGYFIWSLLDNFEWASGYSKRFGIHYVDFESLQRRPKSSAQWYKSYIQSGHR